MPSTSAASCDADNRITPSLRRPAEGAVLEPLPEQHQPGPIPGQNLQTISPLRAEDVDRPRKRIVLELLAHQCSETVGPAAEVHRLGGHQHPNAGRNRDHVTAFTARSTACNVPASIPAGTRTVAALITISITKPPGHAGAIATSEHGAPASTITGAKTEPLSSASCPARRCAVRRHPKSCCGVNPYRRATADTVSPSA